MKRNEVSGLQLSSRLLASSNDAEGELGPEAWVAAREGEDASADADESKQAEAAKQYTVSGTANGPVKDIHQENNSLQTTLKHGDRKI